VLKDYLRGNSVTPAAEGHGLWPWMNAPAFGWDVAPLGREVGCHGLCPWGSTGLIFWFSEGSLSFLAI